MNNTKLILRIQSEYDARTREQILVNLNYAISLGKSKGIQLDRYLALPKITNRSKHTVMSWFNRPNKKIPLIDLCVISDYLRYNIFAFFSEEGTLQDFLVTNDYYNEHYPNGADSYISAYNLQYKTDKNIVIDNIEKYYGSTEELLLHHSNKRQAQVTSICGCTQNTYYSWFNRSRTNVKIPLISLCKLADAADVDVFSLFKAD